MFYTHYNCGCCATLSSVVPFACIVLYPLQLRVLYNKQNPRSFSVKRFYTHYNCGCCTTCLRFLASLRSVLYPLQLRVLYNNIQLIDGQRLSFIPTTIAGVVQLSMLALMRESSFIPTTIVGVVQPLLYPLQ